MSLFVCEQCRAVENTALCDFWPRAHRENGDTRALCSECGPEGKWHGRFDKIEWDGKRKVAWADGEWLT